MEQNKYDILIVGSGLGGLVSAIILAKEGKRVCVLEKNNQYGGNLQTFVRDKTIFDTGIHYIGGLDEGENLNKYFKYIGIMEHLRLQKMNNNAYDYITFDNDKNEYPHAQGYENFVTQLTQFFPEEEDAIKKYITKIKETCNSFPLYNLKYGNKYDEEILKINAKDCIDQITSNKKLQAVLAGSNLLYAGIPDKTPFYVHALSVNSYIQSSWRCINGGSQITKLLIKQLRKYGGEIYKHSEVTNFEFADGKIISAKTKNGNEYFADIFISNIEPKTTLKMIGEENIKKSYYKRIQEMEVLPSAFSLYLVLQAEKIPYLNYNYYHTKDENKVWDSIHYTEESWPESYLISMNVSEENQKWAESITAICYLRFDEMEKWKNTHNTVAENDFRGDDYETFKNHKAEIFITELEKKFPNLRECIKSVHTSSPLSYRDYIGGHNGNLYGYVKDSSNPMKSFISSKTKVENLLLTGQSVNMHGVLGVTIGAVVTCSEILGKEYLINKINSEVNL